MRSVAEMKYFRFVATFGAILILLVFNGWFLYFNFQRIGEHEFWVQHTNQVLSRLDNILQLTVDMETGQRGYLLFKDRVFLEPYRNGTLQIEPALQDLQQLVADNPPQVQAAGILKDLVEKRVGHLNTLLQGSDTGSITPAARQNALESGRELMHALREQVAKMKTTELDLLERRSGDVERSRTLFLAALIATTLIGLASVSVAARQIRKNQLRMESEAHERAAVARARENLAEAATQVSGTLSPEELAGRIQRFLVDKIQVLGSKFFLFRGGRLELISSYGTDPNAPQASGPRARSLVDEALGRPGLWSVKDVPAEYWQISSSLGAAKPKFLEFVPLTFQGRKLGVMELGMFRELAHEERDFLEKLTEVLSVALSAAQSRSEMQELLEKTQQQAEELEAQQEELKASNEELEQQARALESQQQSLNIKNRELEETRLVLEEKARDLELSTQYKSDFLAKMSHELRTPLNGLLILSTLLMENKEKNLTDQQKQFAHSIHTAGNDLLMLINDILDLSKIEARKLSLRPENFTLSGVAESLRLAFEPQAKTKGIEFRVDFAPEVAETHMRTDRQRLEQILRNFLSNALKFTATGFVGIEAKLLAGGREVEIAVSDSGIGVPEDKRDLIFQAFEQADSSVSRKFGGTGLGLTISRELAALLGGMIVLESKEGEGSRFILKIPTQLPEGSEAPAPAPRLASETTARTAVAPREQVSSKAQEQMATRALDGIKPGERTILIVEDDRAFLESAKEAAQGYGFQVITAGDGELALAILERTTPDAILLDIKLPGISGLGLLEMIKQMPQLRHIPVHMISALDYQHNALRLGALGYLTKPVTMEKIRSALGRIETLISGRVRKILLIEDDERQSDAVTNLIAGSDVQIDSAHSGREALARLREASYDCVILDLTLPDISGFEMLEQLNSLEISVPPIVIYTGKDLSPKEEEYLRRFSESIIIKGARSPERLLDEVNLFLHRVESLLPSEKREMLSQLRSQKDNFEGKTVLVVDDDLRNVFALTSALETKNLNVRIAKDGVEALESLEKNTDIDIVLMDIMMPRMDGFEAMRRIRASDDARIRALPIIALTAKAMREDHEKCIEAGASDYIPKPVDLNQLSTILKVWLAPKGIFA